VILDFTVAGVYLSNRDKTIHDAGGNNNGILDPGETADITVLLKNFGTQSGINVSGTLFSSASGVTINDNAGFWGTIAPSDSAENTADPFNVTVSSAVTMGTVVDFTLIVTANGGYLDTLGFSIVVGGEGLDYVTHDCGNVKFSVTRYGSLGYMSAFAPNPGDGFCYPATSLSHLFIGTLAVGRSSAYCLDRYFKGGTCDDDWQTTGIPDGGARMYEPGPYDWDEYATARFDDAGHPSGCGLVCEQWSWAWDDATANDFVIVRFNLRNEGSVTLSNLYAALFMDWDVGTATSNQGASDASRNLTWVYQSTPYVGVAILDPPRTTPAANLSMVSHLDYVYPLNGLPDSMMIKFMDGTISLPTTDTIYDWTACNSSGPFALAPSDTFVAAFAVLGGDNLTDLQNNADTAYNRYWGTIGTEEHKEETVLLNMMITPSITRDGNFTLSYNLRAEVPVTMKVYNTLGQMVQERNFGMCTGIGNEVFDLKAHAQGVYFVQVEAGNTKTTTKIILCK